MSGAEEVWAVTQTPFAPSIKTLPRKQENLYDLSQMEPWREFAVTLYNDEDHSMDEVVGQLMKALQCTPLRAQRLMLEAHTKGQAVVAIAGKPKANRIATVLRQIDLRVILRQIN